MKWIPTSSVGRLRAGVVAFAFLMALFKLWIAKHTYGSFDVLAWEAFARTVHEYGPVGIYGQHSTMEIFGQIRYPLYNHPPMSGWMLFVMNWLADRGIGLPFLIRVPATLADIVSAWLLFELVRRVRTPKVAAAAATFMTLSPVLITVSGFHGNTDPVFVMFTLLTVYLVLGRRPLLAGLSIGLALSVKLVPIVVLPLLIVTLYRQGWKQLLRFALGGSVIFTLLWVPVLVSHPRPFIADVLGYRGVSEHLYGIPQFMAWLELPKGLINLYAGPGSNVVLVVCAALGAWIVWRRPDAIISATGVTLCAFLLLSPAFGVQYMAWAVAAAFLIGLWPGALYSFIAGVFLVQIYSTWSEAKPGHWWYAIPVYWRPREFALMTLAWLALGLATFLGLRAEFGDLVGSKYKNLRARWLRQDPAEPLDPAPIPDRVSV